jgi:colicin import membrane protein
MHSTKVALQVAGLVAAGLLAGAAQAGLPPPSPAAQQAAAAKKAEADAQAAKDKQSLAASMDAVSAHWRSQAGQKGWKTHPPVAIAAAPAPAPAAGAAPAVGAAPAAGGSSAAVMGAAPAGQPDGKLTAAGAAAPIKSEKLGTAPPSKDVKLAPTQAQPKNAPPTVEKGTPDVKNR